MGLTNEDLIKKIDPGLENDTKDVFNISLLEDLDIRPHEADELVKINPKIAKALVRLAHDHNDREHEVGEDIEKKIKALKKVGLEVLEEVSKSGYKGQKVVFLHPKSTNGVLIELVEEGIS